MDLIWLIPLIPGIGAAINGLVGIRLFSKAQSATVACASMGIAAVLSLMAFVDLLGLEAREHVVVLAN